MNDKSNNNTPSPCGEGRGGVCIITGADGGMGTEITREVAMKGYHVVMVCINANDGQTVCNRIKAETGNDSIEVRQCDLSSMAQVRVLADGLKRDFDSLDLLMNNAGTMQERRIKTEDGFEKTVAVNYMAPYLLTRLLVPIMHRGTRVVCMVSVSSAIGRLRFPQFFTHGRKGGFWRIPVYSNTKLALTLFVLRLARMLKDRGVTVNGADPGVVSTGIIRMNMWFDPITDLIYRPVIRTPRQGADMAIRLLLGSEGEATGNIWHNVTHLTWRCQPKANRLGKRYTDPHRQERLWQLTEERLAKWL